jgi:hypothetical protein
MKKIIIMLSMMVLATFASPLFAIDTSPPDIEKVNSINDGKMVNEKNGLGLVGVAHADNSAFAKMDAISTVGSRHNLETVTSNKAMDIIGYKQNANMNLAHATLAVVCYPRGV